MVVGGLEISNFAEHFAVAGAAYRLKLGCIRVLGLCVNPGLFGDQLSLTINFSSAALFELAESSQRFHTTLSSICSQLSFSHHGATTRRDAYIPGTSRNAATNLRTDR